MQKHPFINNPHRTLLGLSIPVLFSLVAEPLTGLADTAFIKVEGVQALAALGVGAAALSSIFWVFGFLGIGTQTQIAQLSGKNLTKNVAEVSALALALSLFFGLLFIVVGWPLSTSVARLMGAEGAIQQDAALYMRVRLLGGPAVIGLMAAFGVLRGLQDMKTPLWIAVSLNGINIALDALLISGAGPIPAYGIVGAAWASVVAQWVGAIWAAGAVFKRVGLPGQLRWQQSIDLLKVGGDLFIRSGLLTGFLLLTTRVATQAGAGSAAAHQAIRGMWFFIVLGLNSLALTAQSLVGYFYGAAEMELARRVARFSAVWSFWLGVGIAVGLWLGRWLIIEWLVPESAIDIFLPAWLVTMVGFPISVLGFATDGIHWGTGDFPFLRNTMIVATFISAVGLLLIDTQSLHALTWIWGVMILWATLRAALGFLRIWPGIGASPLLGLSDRD
jgi:MATE family multidrug resistance protein